MYVVGAASNEMKLPVFIYYELFGTDDKSYGGPECFIYRQKAPCAP